MTARPPLQPRLLRAAAAALLATVALGPVPGLAPAPAAVAAEESAPVMVVLDASGSMLNDDAPGLRIDAAKAAVKDLIDDVPDSARMGLMVYGTGTDSSPGAKKAGCSDIKTLAPVGPVDKDKLTAAVDNIKPPAIPRWGRRCARPTRRWPARKARAPSSWFRTVSTPARPLPPATWPRNYRRAAPS